MCWVYPLKWRPQLAADSQLAENRVRAEEQSQQGAPRVD